MFLPWYSETGVRARQERERGGQPRRCRRGTRSGSSQVLVLAAQPRHARVAVRARRAARARRPARRDVDRRAQRRRLAAVLIIYRMFDRPGGGSGRSPRASSGASSSRCSRRSGSAGPASPRSAASATRALATRLGDRGARAAADAARAPRRGRAAGRDRLDRARAARGRPAARTREAEPPSRAGSAAQRRR